MATYPHAAVWLDHAEAKLFRIGPETFEMTTVAAPQHHIRRHASRTREVHHPADDQQFFRAVTDALQSAREILVLGPGNAKLELMKYVQKHAPGLEAKIVGVQTIDHPTDREIVAFARSYLLAVDRRRAAFEH
jgi:stalled ribosome rescue protein Dom34